ncbi:hypothetical protein BU14_0314s0017 [Porphyra umbilicalis]|uniref:Nucleoside phosphorylase domain-containing protein n=1 Tax=Porphyra umbilicalis TaxID=2786 RepID=A0A1X6NZJ0_PORUM|nr:hypothetical protein BU14_0314s0017 [Porphyra umbilicalis]|eukprot:OSX74014.1 hypothetical protein BU14_0314s0017 [Porphyra umbilicalis]
MLQVAVAADLATRLSETGVSSASVPWWSAGRGAHAGDFDKPPCAVPALPAPPSLTHLHVCAACTPPRYRPLQTPRLPPPVACPPHSVATRPPFVTVATPPFRPPPPCPRPPLPPPRHDGAKLLAAADARSPPPALASPLPSGTPCPTAAVDVLFHLGLRVARNPGAAATDTDDVAALFGRVTHAVLCGSASRARALAAAFADDAAGGVTDVTRTDRYALFLSAGGRVAVASHGIGRPSVGIVLHELTKLFRYARAGGVDGATAAASAATAALPPVTYYRVGTCGGVGVEAGTLVLTRNVVDGRLRGEVGTTVLGVSRTEAAVLDPATVASLTAYARGVVGGKAPPPPSLGDGGGAGRCGGGDPTAHARHCAALHQVVVGTTATLDGFYEEQGRMDGASCSFDEAQRAAWLRHAHEAGVRNFEMEGLEFAAFTHRHGIPAAMACVALLNRLNGDQVTSPPDQLAAWEDSLIRLIVGYVQQRLEGESTAAGGRPHAAVTNRGGAC